MYEYSWAFADAEDFCWNHSVNGKIVSIDKDGLAAKKLLLADFGTNTGTGRTLLNTIDVGARLATYQSAFEAMRSGISTSTDYDSLKANLLTALASV